MNYEDLTKRIEIAEAQKASLCPSGYVLKDENWWSGYLAALHDIRNDLNTGGRK